MLKKWLTFVYLVLIFSKLNGKIPAIEELTLEEKVGQLLMVHFYGEEANEQARFYLRDQHVGGFIYYAWTNQLTSPEQVQKLSSQLQDLASQQPKSIPLLIAVDQEGGAVIRLNRGFTQFPGNRALGVTGDPALAEQCAWAMGKELRSVGVNTNLAPVVDVNNNRLNPIIGIRSFGSDPQLVADMGEKMLQGFKKASVLPVLKHFPGHGDVTVDSHEALPVIQKDRETLNQTELYPFYQLLPHAPAVMTAHILVPAIDAQKPISLSPKGITQLLQKELGFNGLILTDSLCMQGALARSKDVVDAAVQSFNAGHDILLLGGKALLGGGKESEITPADVQKIHQTLVDMVKAGTISEERLNRSVAKILKIKESLAPTKERVDLAQAINTPEHQKLAKKIAEGSVLVVSSQPHEKLDLYVQKVVCVAPAFWKDNVQSSLLSGFAKQNYFYDWDPNESEIQAALAATKEADLCVLCTYNSWKYKGQKNLAKELIKQGTPTIVLLLGDNWDFDSFAAHPLVICTHSPVLCALDIAAMHVEKEYHEAL